ncbi:MAG: hypothetical protein ABI193_02405 [Minicystis sp.]
MSARASAGALVIAASLAATGCCGLIDLVLTEPEPAPDPLGPAQELGTAAYPPGASTARPVLHTWSAKRLAPGTYRVGYTLSPAEAGDVEDDYQAFARKVSYEDQGKGSFRWAPPQGCSGDLHCVYENIVARDRADLDPLIERFKARQAEAHLNALDVAWLVVTFVQSIRYEIPEKEPFGILPPALVAQQKRGDCDSKALLGLMLLRALGIDSIILSSSAHKHAMLGIALPAPGTKMTYSGRAYMFTEMTAKGSPIGHINPELLKPDDWRPVPFRYPEGVKAAPLPTAPKAPTPKPAPSPRKGR